MKEKLRKIVKSRIFIFVCAALLFGSIGVSAATYFPSVDVTYDNKESGLVSTDVQGAIDELYGVCTVEPPAGGNGILEKVPIVTSGDGLYKDEYEDGRYFYKGANPNNFLVFNVQKWRIISIENDGSIKIINTNAYDAYSNETYSWAGSTLNTYYLKNDLDTINSNTINAKRIITHDWAVGRVSENTSDMQTLINAENSQKLSGKIATITISEFLRTNSNKSSCNSMTLYMANYNTCYKTTWLYNSEGMWTINGNIDNKGLYGIYRDKINSYNSSYSDSYTSTPLYQVVYLSANTEIYGGSGTSKDPYVIS